MRSSSVLVISWGGVSVFAEELTMNTYAPEAIKQAIRNKETPMIIF
jgi:hypothetical protein